jgi:hypothetical protein
MLPVRFRSQSPVPALAGEVAHRYRTGTSSSRWSGSSVWTDRITGLNRISDINELPVSHCWLRVLVSLTIVFCRVKKLSTDHSSETLTQALSNSYCRTIRWSFTTEQTASGSLGTHRTRSSNSNTQSISNILTESIEHTQCQPSRTDSWVSSQPFEFLTKTGRVCLVLGFRHRLPWLFLDHLSFRGRDKKKSLLKMFFFFKIPPLKWGYRRHHSGQNAQNTTTSCRR